jgi:hypothetical protein
MQGYGTSMKTEGIRSAAHAAPPIFSGVAQRPIRYGGAPLIDGGY